MAIMYLAILPLAALVLKTKVALVSAAIKSGDRSRIKAKLFFLGLVMAVIIGLILCIEAT